ncbi:spore germination protein GerPC [Cytobacillus sp. FJAT-54145]|uniref:Spore germination protein GerPC n=1 Tax=Cytobacillus spartinae TaxID=3299023 RepID=A0ABW6K7K5_9BACI
MNNYWPYTYYPYNYQPQQPIDQRYYHPKYVNHTEQQQNQNLNQEQNLNLLQYQKQENEQAPTSSPSSLVETILEKLNKIEEEHKKLKKEIENIKPVTIENVNYKIQDLSVQELSGTLLVGLTSLSDAEELKKLLTEKGPVSLNDMDTEDIQNSMGEENTTENQES